MSLQMVGRQTEWQLKSLLYFLPLIPSDDRTHDWEQVEAMERRAMEIHKEEFGLQPHYWHRVTDGCQTFLLPGIILNHMKESHAVMESGQL